MKPILDRVIIKQQPKDEKTASGIILAPSAQEEKPRGEVIGVGGEVKEVKVGDFVLFNVNYHQKFTNNGQEFVTIVEKDILAILSPDEMVAQKTMKDGVGVQKNGVTAEHVINA